jgi:DNA (cytosine-5)-methyltransferase 1
MHLDIPDLRKDDLARRCSRLNLRADGPDEAEFLAALMWAIACGGAGLGRAAAGGTGDAGRDRLPGHGAGRVVTAARHRLGDEGVAARSGAVTMPSTAYYNEHDPRAARWLRNLIEAGLLPDGSVDGRDIQEVTADDVRGDRDCHWFAGIGGWPLALRLAGWPSDEPVWTGSCPCPPFSSAGKKQRCPECGGARPVPCPRRTGYFICLQCEHAWHADDRHLWPEFWRLVRDCRPAVIFGEQVASPDGRIWYAGVRASLERLGYAVGCADLCAAGAGEEAEGLLVCGDQGRWERIVLGAPHIRQRLFWVADSQGARRDQQRRNAGSSHVSGISRWNESPDGRDPLRMEYASGDGRLQGWPEPVGRGVAGGRGTGGLGHASGDGWEQGATGSSRPESDVGRPGVGFWSAYDLIPCRDGKARRVEPGSFPLAHGVPGRVGRLRGYGNAIVPEVAVTFIRAYREARAC